MHRIDCKDENALKKWELFFKLPQSFEQIDLNKVKAVMEENLSRITIIETTNVVKQLQMDLEKKRHPHNNIGKTQRLTKASEQKRHTNKFWNLCKWTYLLHERHILGNMCTF
jgi:hypothetical protein